jgi:hypothetical protein
MVLGRDVERSTPSVVADTSAKKPARYGMTWRQYKQSLEVKLVDLHARVRRGAHRAQPSRREVGDGESSGG